MKLVVKSLDEAVTVLLDNLDRARREELAHLVLNSRLESGRRWMREVIEMFDLEDSGSALVADIDRRFPDESALKEIEADGGEPIFEAKTVLRETQRKIREQSA